MSRQPGLGLRYAEALFGAALSRGVVEAVGADLVALLELDARDPSLRNFLESPAVRDDHKLAVIDSVVGPRADALTVRFLRLLLKKKRMGYLRDAAEAFATLVERHQGVVRARATSALALTEDERTRLRAALERRTGHKILLEARVDPEVLGGVVVQYGDHILDDTVRTRLAELRERLLAAEA